MNFSGCMLDKKMVNVKRCQRTGCGRCGWNKQFNYIIKHSKIVEMDGLLTRVVPKFDKEGDKI